MAILGLACLAVVGLLYFRAVGFGLVGDDVGFVHPDPDWLQHILRPSGQWHFYPLNTAVCALLGIVSGGHPAPLHMINLILHAGVGVALGAWLARFGLNVWIRLLVAVFFVSRGIHYEVVAWITELSYLSVSLYTLLALACWDHYLRGHGTRYLAATAATYVAAVFTIEHALLIAPICFLYDVLLGPSALSVIEDTARRPHWTRRSWRTLAADALKYLPFVLVIVTFLGIKRLLHVGLSMSLATGSGPPPPVASGMDVTLLLPSDRTWLGFLNTPVRAYRDLLSATTFLFLPTSLAFGPDDGVLTRFEWIVLIPWLAVQIGILWKGSPLARFLLIWVYVYELPLAAGSVPQARYYYMASMPASALVGVELAALYRRLAGTSSRAVVTPLTVALMAALVIGESRFIGARLGEWKAASDLVRTTANDVQTWLSPNQGALVLVNLPRSVPGPFWPAYAFANAAENLPMLFHPPRRHLDTHVVYDRTFVDERWPTIGRYMPRDSIDQLVASPGTGVFEFTGRPPRVVPVR